jgi:peptidyl-prolyl cis-trans isomerase-like 2
MANRGKNTNTSQFFISFKAVPHLDFKHTVFGKMREGYSVLDKIEKYETGEGGLPKQDIIITKAVV